MVKWIERDIKENGAASLFTQLCPAASNCDLQSARHDAGWYKGDKLTGAYQVGKDFKFGADPAINDVTKSSLLASTSSSTHRTSSSTHRTTSCDPCLTYTLFSPQFLNGLQRLRQLSLLGWVRTWLWWI